MTGQEFRIFRKETLKRSITDLAYDLDVSRQTIYNWEAMPQIPTTIELSLKALTLRKNKKSQVLTVK